MTRLLRFLACVALTVVLLYYAWLRTYRAAYAEAARNCAWEAQMWEREADKARGMLQKCETKEKEKR